MLQAIDFFSGAGGATAGLESSNHIRVVAAVNHDPAAIECHKDNHPEVDHYNMDVREVNANDLAHKYPDVKVFWWSAECTHFSKAKGGQSRDADSRMLNHELIRFAAAIQPDYIFIENVTEFRTWGPLDEDGKPVKDRQGEYYFKWIRLMENLGYHYEDRDLNAADYGARTSRVRLFGLFTRPDIAIRWPRQTHAKDPEPATMFNPSPLKRWEPVGPVLDLDNWGESIFNREQRGKKPLSPKTIARIEYGLNKFFPAPDGVPYVLRQAPEGIELPTCQVCEETNTCQFLIKYHSTGNNVVGLDEPASTITTKDRLCLATCQYVVKQWSGDGNSQSIEEPHHTITTKPAGQLVTPMILPYNYGNLPQETGEPLSTIMAKRDKYLVLCQFIEKTYNDKNNVQRVEQPAGTITTVPKLRLISGLLVDWRIQNVYMRMLTVPELLAAQGFPPDYKMPKSATLGKKFIGNSVPPNITELFTHCQFGTEEQRISGVREYAMAS